MPFQQTLKSSFLYYSVNMRIQKRKIGDKIYLLIFKTQTELSTAFMRIQEHYDSSKFKGRIFTYEEFREWYIKTNKGKFSYNHDWSGFNVPSKALKSFYAGKFNPISDREKQILNLFRKKRGNFYIIAIFEKYKPFVVKHELAHALFYLDKDYKREVLNIVRKYNLPKIRKKLLSFGDYNNKILNDEVQAYSVALSHGLKTPFPPDMVSAIEKIFSKYKKRWNIKI